MCLHHLPSVSLPAPTPETLWSKSDRPVPAEFSVLDEKMTALIVGSSIVRHVVTSLEITGKHPFKKVFHYMFSEPQRSCILAQPMYVTFMILFGWCNADSQLTFRRQHVDVKQSVSLLVAASQLCRCSKFCSSNQTLTLNTLGSR